jgi:DUF438 domain-containing protein
MLDKLPIDTIAAIFEALPMEVSFVDSDDTVRDYSKGDKRIFRRTPSVIGMKVQKCHPQKSVDKVAQILADFRAGARDTAEFWIDLKGRTVLIRYFAVRDTAGAYLGCLEATQDITDLKKIEGEKRLLD